MGVHDRHWKRYDGPLGSPKTRWLVLARYVGRDVFKTRIFTFFFTACMLLPALLIAVVYVSHNLDLLESLSFLKELHIEVTSAYYLKFFSIQGFLAWALTLIVGPALLCPDFVNGALPLYLSRPLRRWEYLAGKSLPLWVILSVVTWIPALVAFGLEATYRDWSWLLHHLGFAIGILASGLLIVVCLTLPALAVSAVFKSRASARTMFVVIPFVMFPVGGIMNGVFHTHWGMMLMPPMSVEVVVARFLGAESSFKLPWFGGAISLVAIVLLSIEILRRRLRAVEVVR